MDAGYGRIPPAWRADRLRALLRDMPRPEPGTDMSDPRVQALKQAIANFFRRLDVHLHEERWPQADYLVKPYWEPTEPTPPAPDAPAGSAQWAPNTV